MPLSPLGGLRGKLYALALLTSTAMASVVLIAWVAYGQIERLSSTLADREMVQIFDNARLGRAMSESLAQIDRKTRWRCDQFAMVHAYGQVKARTAPAVLSLDAATSAPVSCAKA